MTLVHEDELLQTVQQRLHGPTVRPTTSNSSAALTGGEAPRLAVAAVITQADIAHLAEGALLRYSQGQQVDPAGARDRRAADAPVGQRRVERTSSWKWRE